MKRHMVSSSAKSDFLTDATTVAVDSADVSPRIYCAHQCLAMRSTHADTSACNSYLHEGGECKLNYREPNWLLEQVRDLGQEDEGIYFDLMLP